MTMSMVVILKAWLLWLSLLCTLCTIAALDVDLQCRRSSLASVHINSSHGGPSIFSGEGIAITGCMVILENTSIGNMTVRVSWNSSVTYESAVDEHTGCFDLSIRLVEPGNHTLSLTAVEDGILCNGSSSLAVEVRPCVLMAMPVTSRLVYLSHTAGHSRCLQSASIGTLIHGSLEEGMIVDRPGYGGALLVTYSNTEVALNGTVSEWSFQEELCWLELYGESGFETTTHELDFGDHLELVVKSSLTGIGEGLFTDSLHVLPAHMWDISIQFSNPDLFDYYTVQSHHWNQTVLKLHIWQKAPNNALSVVEFHCVYCLHHCQGSTVSVGISSGCPESKHLRFTYPERGNLHTLPVNYRPPSWLGTAIPTSPHIYNADPSRPLMNTYFAVSKASAVFKQCHGQSRRKFWALFQASSFEAGSLGTRIGTRLILSQCNCSRDLEASTDVAFSDCIAKVYHHPFDSPFPLRFSLELGDGVLSPVAHPIAMEELNNRTDFSIAGHADDGLIVPGGRVKEMTFHGPGLYHFKATVLTNSSLCQLTAQFTVYVDRVPLLRAMEYSLASITVVLFGILTFGCNLYYRRSHHHHH